MLYIGDSFEMLTTDSKCCWPSLYWKSNQYDEKSTQHNDRHLKIVTNIYAPTSLEPTVYVYKGRRAFEDDENISR